MPKPNASLYVSPILPNKDAVPMLAFMQKMLNRLGFGHVRYGSPKASSNHLKKLKRELRAYEETNNLEHLYNVANYCILESMAPSRGKGSIHDDPTVKSVTRRRSIAHEAGLDNSPAYDGPG